MKKDDEKHEDDKYLYLLYEKKDEDYWKRYWKNVRLGWGLIPVVLALLFYLLVELFKYLQ